MKRYVAGFMAAFFLAFTILASVNSAKAKATELIIPGALDLLEVGGVTALGMVADYLVDGFVIDLVDSAVDEWEDFKDAVCEYIEDPDTLGGSIFYNINQALIDCPLAFNYEYGEPIWWWKNLTGRSVTYNLSAGDFSQWHLRHFGQPSSDGEVVDPGTEYATLLGLINGQMAAQTNYWNAAGNYHTSVSIDDWKQYTWIRGNRDYMSNGRGGFGGSSDYYEGTYWNQEAWPVLAARQLGRIDIVSVPNTAYYTFTFDCTGVDVRAPIFTDSQRNRQFWMSENTIYGSLYGDTTWNFATTTQIEVSQGTLLQCLQKIADYVRNVDIYLDGTLISKSQAISTNKPTPFIPGIRQRYGPNPIRWQFPEPVILDYDKLEDYIIDAINNSKVLKYEDVQDVFLNVQGQPCIATYTVIRNDYDDVMNEQYPGYLGLNNYLTDDTVQPALQYADNAAEIFVTSTSFIPDELKYLLSAVGVMLLIAFLVNRMLE